MDFQTACRLVCFLTFFRFVAFPTISEFLAPKLWLENVIYLLLATKALNRHLSVCVLEYHFHQSREMTSWVRIRMYVIKPLE